MHRTSGGASTSGAPAPAAEQRRAIDVDQFYMKYEYDSEDDEIVTIDARTFREGVRREREREKEKRLSMSVAPTVPPPASGSGSAQLVASSSRSSSGSRPANANANAIANTKANVRHATHMVHTNVGKILQRHTANMTASANAHVNAVAGPSQVRTSAAAGVSVTAPPSRRVPTMGHPSQTGAAIQQLRQQQKRSISDTPQPSESTVSQKRRKLEIPPAPSSVHSASTHHSVDIFVGPPGRRSTLSTKVESEDNLNATTAKRMKPISLPSLPPPPPPPLSAVQKQGVKRVIMDVIELSSDGEEVRKILTPRRKKQKQKQRQSNPVSSTRSYSPIEIISSDPEIDLDVQPTPQFDNDDVYKYEDELDHHYHPLESAVQRSPEPAPVPEPELPLLSDDYDDESEWDPIGDIYDSAKWHSSTYHLEDDEDEADRLDIARLKIGEKTTKSSQSPARYTHPNTSKWVPRPSKRSVASPVEFIWDKLRAAGNVHVRPRVRTRRALTMPSYVRPWNLDFDLHTVKMEHSFKKAPGSINKIEQSGPWTAIASASIGGLPDTEHDERSSAYNRPGSLLTWGAGGLDIPSGHIKTDQATRNPIKYYAVHDVKFDPLSTTIVSSGADSRIRVWNLEDEVAEAGVGGADDNAHGHGVDEEDFHHDPNATPAPENESRWTSGNSEKYYRVPHDIAFKPGSSILAVAEKKCHIYELTNGGKCLEKNDVFRLQSPSKAHIVGSILWGAGPTKDLLFASSEPDPNVQLDEPCYEGVHKVYSVERKAFVYELDSKEAGDTMTVDSIGGTLALSTRGAENKLVLRLYDIKRNRPRATAAIQLAPFEQRHPTFEGEVNCAAFSPDGVYIALARNDNRVHMYDVRMLVRGPVLDYEHWGESRVPGVMGVGDGLYGVVKAQWVWSEGTRRMALVTGGEDGCVRLWNPLLSGDDETNGTSVARMNSDIAHFSIGDRFAGEHQLVAGDSSGEVMIFNNIII